jgi:hypothetical protein
MSEDTLIEPGGWLAEHQRATCTGASALTTYQGLIADEIVLPQSAADARDPAQFVLACDAFVDAAQNHAYLIAGEFAPEAVWNFYAHDYINQARGGGHEQYWASRGGNTIALRACAAALKSMLAGPHLDVFNLLLRLKRANPRDARRIAKQAGYSSVKNALRDLDKRLNDLEQKEPLAPRQKVWLKSFRKLTIAPDAELPNHMRRIAATNALFQQRRAEAQRLNEERQRSDPAYRAVLSLCEMAGVRLISLAAGAFAPMREVWPEGPDRGSFGFRVETDAGVRFVLFYLEGGFTKKRLAVLIEPGQNLPLGSLTLAKAEYEAIVPNAR